MADAYVQIIPDSTGAKVDVTELTRQSGTVVERQRFALGDDMLATSLARVSTGRELLVDAEIFHEMLAEMRKTNLLLSLLVGEDIS